MVARRSAIAGALASTVAVGACEVPSLDRAMADRDAGSMAVPVTSPIADVDWPTSEGDPAPRDSTSEPVLASVPVQGCAQDMVLIEGRFCPVVQQDCLRWLEPPEKNHFARCARFAAVSTCRAERISMRFCMDRLEAAGERRMPLSDISWSDSAAFCKSKGRRLCREREWLFACEGDQMAPYPYGAQRNAALCNIDRTSLVSHGKLVDLRHPVTSHPKCVSGFGVQNMAGNVDEWVVLDEPWTSPRGEKLLSGLKGGWWGPMRGGCRPVTVGHDQHFRELQIGFRCCSDAP
jgi:formylglycine-generating enzyme